MRKLSAATILAGLAAATPTYAAAGHSKLTAAHKAHTGQGKKHAKHQREKSRQKDRQESR